jgi:peptidoglycan/LPS O-acetylase OafA/YrhL
MGMSTAPGRADYYPSLDGLRGVAALCVLIIHRGVWFHLDGRLAHGYLAVDFFFMLSGFVIAGAYEAKLTSGRQSIGAFVRARVFRLYPLIALGMVIGAAWGIAELVLGSHGAAPAGQLLGLFARGLFTVPMLAPNAVGVGVFPLDAPTWSLFFEMVANLAYVLALRWMTTRRLIAVVALSGLALIWLALTHGGVDHGGTAATFWGGFPRTAFPFFAGVLLWRLRDWRPLQWPQVPVAAQAVLLLALFSIPGRGGLAGGLIDLFCVGLAFPAILALSIRSAPGPAASRACLALGALSYPLYVLHYPIYIVIGGIGRELELLDRSTMHWFGMVSVPVILAASWAAHALYDKPVRRWLAGLGRDRAQQPAAALASAEAAAP